MILMLSLLSPTTAIRAEDNDLIVDTPASVSSTLSSSSPTSSSSLAESSRSTDAVDAAAIQGAGSSLTSSAASSSKGAPSQTQNSATAGPEKMDFTDLPPSEIAGDTPPPSSEATSPKSAPESAPSERGTKSASSTAAVIEKPPYLKILELRVDITERAYQMESTPLNLAEVINAHEQVLSAQCFGDLRTTLEYQGYPSDEDCRTRIKRVLELDGTSSVALCAQHGIDSPECRQSSALMSIGSYSIDSGAWRSIDGKRSGRIELISLQDAIKQKGANKRLSEAQSKIYGAAAAARLNPRDYSLIQKLESIARPALQEVCIAPRLSLEQIAEQTSASSPDSLDQRTTASDLDSLPVHESEQATDTSEKDPFSDLIKSLDAKGAARAVPTPTALAFEGPNYRRYRLIPDECERIVRQVADISPSSPVVQCFRYGPVSLPCIQARRIAAPSTQSSAAGSAGLPQRPVTAIGGGFDSF